MKKRIFIACALLLFLAVHAHSSKVLIGNPEQNVLFAGIENPILVQLPGVSDGDLKLTCEEATITKRNGRWYVIPSKDNFKNEIDIKVLRKTEAGYVLAGTKRFRVSFVAPEKNICFVKDDKCKSGWLSDLLAPSTRLQVSYDEWMDLEPPTIVSFDIFLKGKVFPCTGDTLSEKSKIAIAALFEDKNTWYVSIGNIDIAMNSADTIVHEKLSVRNSFLITKWQEQETTPAIVRARDSLSAIFSKEFVLPDSFLMNTMNVDIHFQIRDGEHIDIVKSQVSSPITRLTDPHNPNHDFSNDFNQLVSEWVAKHQDGILKVLSQNHSPSTPYQKICLLQYSPMYYAQTGDTLFFSGELANQAGAHGEKAGMLYNMYVRNHKQTPYYAIVHRDEEKLKLSYYDSVSPHPFLVEKYEITAPDIIRKHGNQYYMAENSKQVRIIQTYVKDTLHVAEEMNDMGIKIARYLFQSTRLNQYPQLRVKEQLYPSGNVQMRITYRKENDFIEGFAEDGTPIACTPAKDTDREIYKYIKTFFRAPKIGKYDAEKFAYFILKCDILCSVDEKGNLNMVQPSISKTDWSYNRNFYVADKQVQSIVQEKYGPYFSEFYKTMREQTFHCTPAMIGDTPVSSTVTVHIEYKFVPK